MKLKKVDLERLQSLVYGKRSGRTFRMLVEAIQNTEFSNDAVVVVAYASHYAEGLCREAQAIAKGLGFPVETVSRNVLRVNNIDILFISKDSYRKLCGVSYVEFWDHYQG